MGFQKGQPRPANAGRKKGSKNKRKVARVADILAEKGINPVDEILKLINGKDEKGKPLLGPSLKLTAWFDLQSYCQAKPKALDNEPNDIDPEEFEDVTTADLLTIVGNSDRSK